MNARLLFTAALAFAACPTLARAQAAAETVITNSATGTTTTGLGSRMNENLKRGLNRLSDRIQQQVPAPPRAPAPHSPNAARKHAAPTVAAQSPVTKPQQAPPKASKDAPAFSIHGDVKCSSAGQQNPGPCRSRSSSAKTNENAYRSVITLPASN